MYVWMDGWMDGWLAVLFRIYPQSCYSDFIVLLHNLQSVLIVGHGVYVHCPQ